MPTSRPTDLLYLFNLLLLRWRFLLAGTVAIMAAAAAGTFIAEETYESSAKLLVSSPKFVGGLDVFPREFNEPTVGQMAESGVVYEDLARVLRGLHEAVGDARDDRDRALGISAEILASGTAEIADRFGWEPSDIKARAVQALSPRDIAGVRLMEAEDFELMDARSLSEMLDVKAEIEFEGPSQIRWEPLLELKARADTAETAASVADIWARLTLEHVREAVAMGTTDALEQLTEAYGAAQAALESVQEQIKDLRRNAMGEVKKERLRGTFELLYGKNVQMARQPLNVQYVEALARIRELENSTATLRELLASLEVDGERIGALALAKEAASTPADSPLSGEAVEARQRRDSYLRANRALREYKIENPIAVEQNRLKEAVRKVDDLRSERNTLAAMLKLSGEVGEGTPELTRLEEQIADAERTVAETNARIAGIEQGLREKELEVTRAQEEWSAFRQEYVRLRQELMSRQEELLGKKALAQSLEARIAEASEEIVRLNEEISEYEGQLSALEAELAAKQKAFDEVTNLHAQIEVASRTPFVSLKLVSAAPVPKTRVSPNRKLIVLVAGFIGFALLCGWVILRENLRSYRSAEATA